MKRISTKEKAAAFNKCRQENEQKTFFYEDLKSLLKEFGIPSTIFEKLNKHGVFIKEIIDGRTLYSFPKQPLHMGMMEKIYNEKRSEVKAYAEKKKVGNKPALISQQQAWDTLVQAGVIRTKFNLNTLKTKYPKVYLDCLEYELNPEK